MTKEQYEKYEQLTDLMRMNTEKAYYEFEEEFNQEHSGEGLEMTFDDYFRRPTLLITTDNNYAFIPYEDEALDSYDPSNDFNKEEQDYVANIVDQLRYEIHNSEKYETLDEALVEELSVDTHWEEKNYEALDAIYADEFEKEEQEEIER